MITACPCLDLEDSDQKVVKIGVEDMPKPGTPTGEWGVDSVSRRSKVLEQENSRHNP